MSRTALQRFGLLLTCIFALACCASAPNASQPEQTAEPRTSPDLQLRLVYSADTKGNYEPCPT